MYQLLLQHLQENFPTSLLPTFENAMKMPFFLYYCDLFGYLNIFYVAKCEYLFILCKYILQNILLTLIFDINNKCVT